MLDALIPNNAVSIIKSDHDRVEALFGQFENSDNARHKKRLVAEALLELKIHAEIEEKVFYPAVRPHLEKDLMNEAEEEHHVARILAAELEKMDGADDHYFAKFMVLAESVRHHVREEERRMLPAVRGLGIDLAALGESLLAMKEKLKKTGVPASAEEKMIARNGRKPGAKKPAQARALRKKKKAAGGARNKTASRVNGKVSSRISGKAAGRKKAARNGNGRKRGKAA